MKRLVLLTCLTFALLGVAAGCGDSSQDQTPAPLPVSGPEGTGPGETAPTAPTVTN